MGNLGRAIFILGLVVAGLGLVLWLGSRLAWFGRLPGDITIRRDNFTLYVPLATCLLLSLILSIILNFIRR